MALTFSPPFTISQKHNVQNCSFTTKSTHLKIAQDHKFAKPRLRLHSICASASASQSIKRAIEKQFPGKPISRVLKSFESVIDGTSLEYGKGTHRHQYATSFIEGLDAVPFYHDLTSESSKLKWVGYLEQHWETIANELKIVTSQKGFQEKGNNVWKPPVVEAANSYGPGWRTLILQDRVWDPVNTNLFPETTAILQNEELGIPSVEAFFARQAPNTGIKLHTDFCNFILTMHLALYAPIDKSWIEVGGERRYWQSGKGLVFNTSFYHQTMNESEDEERHVLLIRFWHPDLSDIERRALSFLFELIEDSDSHPAVIKAAEEMEQELRRGATKSKKKSRSQGLGFGK